jgi:isoleucyl-tRNA synthetase
MLQSELDVLNFWREHRTFEKSVKQRENADPFTFYDGPPFATGLPHWGHIMVSQVKDTMLRYKAQQGYFVPRRWGWDCHGVPIEKMVEKQLGVDDKRQIDSEIGVERFNQTCRDNIMTYDSEWRKTIERIGRWVDMDNQYRTMDNDYIESVWWGLSQLWKKGLIYKDYRISLYSPSIGVPLSHTDVSMEVKYENETLNTPVVRFGVKEEPAKKVIKKVLEQIVFNYNEQIRYKSDIEKRVTVLENGNKMRKVKREEIVRADKPVFESIRWEDFQTDSEAFEELQKLKTQYDIILENIDTLGRLKAILEKTFELSLLSWTTTPWTLPANVALAVGADIDYSMYYLGATSELVILAEKQAIPMLSLQLHEAVVNSPELQHELAQITDSSEYFKRLGVDIVKIASFKGTDLEGVEYRPLFEHPDTDKIESYEQKANIYKVYVADFATEDEGTGIVQIAPAYGQEDFDLKKERNLPLLTSLTPDGEMRSDLAPELKASFGKNFLGANESVIDILDKKNRLFTSFLYTHKAPIYDRDGKKIYYAAQDSWFIGETKLKSRSLELNQEIDWHPANLKDGRFGNGLETAPDWSISRSRYWGSPLPIWQTEDQSKTIFVDSYEKIEEYAVNPIYKIINSRDLNPDWYEDGNTVILTDSDVKLPLGITAVQYRSKPLTSLRDERVLTMKRFAEFAQPLLDEIFTLFERYSRVQLAFTEEEQRLWTTWINTLHPDSKKSANVFYFYKQVEKNDEGEFTPVGDIQMLDLHRPYIDDIVLKDEVGNGYYRVPDVLDTWVDSGSMPFASWHYPFENKNFVEENTPADWIQESQDQTRGWFRVLHVLSTGIFNKPAFKAVNTTGMILAADGRKMSKSKKNFTDPNDLLDKYGADSVRAYLLSSNLLDADSLKFKDTDLQTVFRETTLLLSNSSRYIQFVLDQHVRRDLPTAYKHPLNRWWVTYTKQYVSEIEKAMDSYNIQKAARMVIPYIRDFSTWYIRRTKDILDEYGKETAACLLESTKLFAQATASIQPFNMERLWSVIKQDGDAESVHLTDFPRVEEIIGEDELLLDRMDLLRQIVSEVHSVRKERNVRVRQPLYADFSHLKTNEQFIEILRRECNLLDKDLSKTEGEIFTHESDFGLLKVDLVVDKALSVMGYARDFERAVQAFRKQQGFKAGEIVRMNWQYVDVADEDVLQEVLKQINWDKLSVDISWVTDLSEEIDKKFVVKDLATILVD